MRKLSPGLKILLSTFIYIVPSFLNLTQFVIVPLELQLLLLIAAICMSIFIKIREARLIYVDPEKLLELMIKSIAPEEALSKFRANIMLYEKGKLKIRYAYNMLGMPDRYEVFEPGQGCCGKAFEEDTIKMVDLTKVKHEDYKVKSDRIWKEMKSIISFPIRKVADGRKVIGVLNVDSSLPVGDAGFLDERVRLIIGGYAEIFGELL